MREQNMGLLVPAYFHNIRRMSAILDVFGFLMVCDSPGLYEARHMLLRHVALHCHVGGKYDLSPLHCDVILAD